MNFISVPIKLERILEVNITEFADRDFVTFVVFDIHVMVQSVFCQEDSAAPRTRILQIFRSHFSLESVKFH